MLTDTVYHYRARVYSPELGRFLQTDPIGYEDQMNLYAYVHNDPLNFTDPDGRMSIRVYSRPLRGAGLDVHYTLHNNYSDVVAAPAKRWLGNRYKSVKNAIDRVSWLEGRLGIVPDAVGPLDSASMRRVVALDKALTPHFSSMESRHSRGLQPSPDEFRNTLNNALKETGLADEFKELYGGTADDFVDEALSNQRRSNDPSVGSNSANGMSSGGIRVCSGVGAERGGCR